MPTYFWELCHSSDLHSSSQILYALPFSHTRIIHARVFSPLGPSRKAEVGFESSATLCFQNATSSTWERASESCTSTAIPDSERPCSTVSLCCSRPASKSILGFESSAILCFATFCFHNATSCISTAIPDSERPCSMASPCCSRPASKSMSGFETSATLCFQNATLCLQNATSSTREKPSESCISTIIPDSEKPCSTVSPCCSASKSMFFPFLLSCSGR